jgi:hypothetical protein
MSSEVRKVLKRLTIGLSGTSTDNSMVDSLALQNLITDISN